MRVPCTPVARLNNHRSCVNSIAWAPHSSCHVCTAGEPFPFNSSLTCEVHKYLTRQWQNESDWQSPTHFRVLWYVFSCSCLLTKLSVFNSGRSPSADMGHPTDASRYWRSHLGLHRWWWNQPNTMVLNATGLDSYLLQQLSGNTARVKTNKQSRNRQNRHELCSKVAPTVVSKKLYEREFFSGFCEVNKMGTFKKKKKKKEERLAWPCFAAECHQYKCLCLPCKWLLLETELRLLSVHNPSIYVRCRWRVVFEHKLLSVFDCNGKK